MRERRDPMIAALRASAKVRDGRWIKGAPTHVLAEFLTALGEDGWVLAHGPPACPKCGGRGWQVVTRMGRFVPDDPNTGWGTSTSVRCEVCCGSGRASEEDRHPTSGATGA